MSENSQPQASRFAINGTIGLLSMIWGSTYFVIREGLNALPPFLSCGIRFALASLIFVCLAPWIRRKDPGEAPNLALSIVQGTLGFAVPYGLVYYSETILPSGLVSVLWAVFPMIVALVAYLFLPGEQLGRAQWGGFAIGFVGVVLLFVTDLRQIGPDAIPMGLFLLLSPVSAALSQAYVKRKGMHVSSALLNRNSMAVCTAWLLLLALLFERDEPTTWNGVAIGSILYLTIAGTVVTFGLYYWAMRRAPTYRLAVIAYLTPTLALTVGTVMGEEALHWHTVAGAALILAGVALVMRRN